MIAFGQKFRNWVKTLIEDKDEYYITSLPEYCLLETKKVLTITLTLLKLFSRDNLKKNLAQLRPKEDNTEPVKPEYQGIRIKNHTREITDKEKIGIELSAMSTITPTTILLLCHNNNILEKFKEAGVKGHYEKRTDYTNHFIKEFRTMSDLREATFMDDDDSLYCMTYGQCCKIFRQIHVNLVQRASNKQSLIDSRICIATHIILFDSWFASKDVAVFLFIYNTLLSYGCKMPRIIHFSQGPVISPKILTRFNVESRIDLCWNNIDRPLEPLKDTKTFIINCAALCNERVKIHIVVPDNYFGKRLTQELAKKEIKIVNNGAVEDFDICVVNYDQILLENFKTNHLIIVPYMRRNVEYIGMERCNIVAIISRLSSYSYDDHGFLKFVKVTVLTNEIGDIRYSNIDLNSLMTAYPVNIEELYNPKTFFNNLSEDEQVKLACILADSSIQPGTILGLGVTKAVELSYMNAIVNDGILVVTKMTNTGTFYVKANLNSKMIKFLVKWQENPYLLFPAFCAMTIIERAIDRKPSLILPNAVMDEEFTFKDPFTHQLQIICDYIADPNYGLTVVNPVMMNNFTKKYQADPKALTECITRIIALRSAGLSEDLRYGPFDVNKMVEILYTNDFFPVAKPILVENDISKKYSYVVEITKSTINYIQPSNSIYPPASEIIIMHAENMKVYSVYEQNALKTPELILYAAVKCKM